VRDQDGRTDWPAPKTPSQSAFQSAIKNHQSTIRCHPRRTSFTLEDSDQRTTMALVIRESAIHARGCYTTEAIKRNTLII
jgi:hypothetical protein